MPYRNRKGLLRGSKISDSHATLIPEATFVVDVVKVFPEVTKIVLGEIRSVRPGVDPRIKFVPIRAGFRLEIRGANSNQRLFVYTSNPRATQEMLEKKWSER